MCIHQCSAPHNPVLLWLSLSLINCFSLALPIAVDLKMCVYVACVHEHVHTEDTCRSHSLLRHVDSENRTQVIGLLSKHLHPRNHLPYPIDFYLFLSSKMLFTVVHIPCLLPQREGIVTSVPNSTPEETGQSLVPCNGMPNIVVEILALAFFLSSEITGPQRQGNISGSWPGALWRCLSKCGVHTMNVPGSHLNGTYLWWSIAVCLFECTPGKIELVHANGDFIGIAMWDTCQVNV